MIKARHTWSGKLVLDFCSGYLLQNAFSSITYKHQSQHKELPTLMIANHFSWWDGFIQYHLNKKYDNKRFHVMMLEEQLRRYPILNGCGAFSVRKQSRDVLESLRYCKQLLEDKNNLVLIFPQGKIESLYTYPFCFEKGIHYLLRSVESPVQVVFNVNLVDYFSCRRPGLTIYTQSYNYTGTEPENALEEAYNYFFQQCKKQQQG